MNETTDPCAACERLASIEVMLDTLAEWITRQDQGTTDTTTGHQAKHHDTEDLPHE